MIILNKIAVLNKKNLLTEDMLEDHDDNYFNKNLNKRIYTFIDLFRFKSVRGVLLILIFSHYVLELYYWGLGYLLPYLTSNVFLNIFFFGVIEACAYTLAGFYHFFQLSLECY